MNTLVLYRKWYINLLHACPAGETEYAIDSERGGDDMPLFILDVVWGVSMSLSFELDDDEYGLDDLRSMDMQT